MHSDWDLDNGSIYGIIRQLFQGCKGVTSDISQTQTNNLVYLPPQPTSFIGREQEVADLTARLADPACRLLTLTGGGGIGKTRLSIETARASQLDFEAGLYFVPLQPLEALEFLPFALAETLQFSLTGQASPFQQICDFLHDQTMLLVLDNFEHLLGDVHLSLVSDLLAAAPQLKLLVTSREALNLREEWLYSVEGLTFPAQGQTASLADFTSINLFVERARQVRFDFSPDQDPVALARICQIVAGMPLALELAAAWAKTLTCAEIVAEIQRSLDFLSTRLHNIPDRHRSIQAIFDHTCQQLSDNEQAIFARLSVFRGGFDRAAAQAVAGASLADLSLFLDKSLLYWSPEGRYHMHELLRQYAAEHLAESSDNLAQTQNLHCTYYIEFLHKQLADGPDGNQLRASEVTEAELKNIRAAWQRAVQQGQVDIVIQGAKALGRFCQTQGRYTEALGIFEQAVQHMRQTLDQPQGVLALTDCLMVSSWFYLRHGRIDEAEAALKEIYALYDQFQIKTAPGFVSHPNTMLGIIALIRGDLSTATELVEQVLVDEEKYPHPSNMMMAYDILSQVALAQGDLNGAQSLAEQSIEACERIAERWYMAYPLNTLGNVALARQDYVLARQHFETSYTSRQEFNDPEGMAVTLNHLSNIALKQADYQDAQHLLTESLTLYQKTNDKGGSATSHQGLGALALRQNDMATAQHHFYQALQIAAAIDYTPLILTILLEVGDLLSRVGQAEKGVVLLSLVQHHSAASQELKDRCEAFLVELKPHRSDTTLTAALKRGQHADLATTIDLLLSDLTRLDLTNVEPTLDPVVPSEATANQALIEPLTSRELEVLGYIAAGLQNREIATAMTVTQSTVKTHINNIYRKLDVTNRVQALSRARELGLLST